MTERWPRWCAVIRPAVRIAAPGPRPARATAGAGGSGGADGAALREAVAAGPAGDDLLLTAQDDEALAAVSLAAAGRER